MHPLIFFGMFAGTFAVMEGLTWLTHRYVMHGFLWYLHEDHHRKGPGFFEKNDTFFLIFGIPTFCMILYGTIKDIYWMQAIGYGVMAYGVAYFVVHDVIIHQRFKWFSRTDNIYIRAIRWGHKMHHKHIDKHEGECFGLLFVHRKYWQKIRRDRRMQQNQQNTAPGMQRKISMQHDTAGNAINQQRGAAR
jgi:beta-carotene 3-hydroxylase